MPSPEQIQLIRDYLDANAATYAALSDQEAADLMNTQSETRIRAEMAGAEVYSLTDITEFDGLTEVRQSLWLTLCSIDTFDPANGTPGVSLAVRLFGGGSATVTALQAARQEAVSPAVLYIGIHRVHAPDITAARAL